MKRITVNGAEIATARGTLTYHDVIRLAFDDAFDTTDKFAVTFTGAGEHDVAGRLRAGEAIRVVEGIAFSVVRAPNPTKP